MDRRTFLTGATGAVAVGLAGCLGSNGDSDSEGDYDIGMTANVFDPPEYEVAPGTTVTWKNTSGRPHSVTAYEDEIPDDADYFASGDFDSEQAARDGYIESEGAIRDGETYEHTFDVPGEYEYFCIPHESMNMVGTVVVTEK